MNVYQYISQTNPYVAKAICHNFGYKLSNVNDNKDLGVCLEQVVSNEGEDALRQIMANHPDKDLLLELFAKQEYVNMTGNEQVSCSCKHMERYANFDGAASEVRESRTSSQANTFLMASALILAVAIISKNN